MSRFGGGLGAGLGGGLRWWGPPQSESPGTADLGTGGVGIPSNLLISSGCLGLSGLNLTEGRGGGGGGGGGLCGAGGGGPLVGLGGLVREAVGGLA